MPLENFLRLVIGQEEDGSVREVVTTATQDRDTRKRFVRRTADRLIPEEVRIARQFFNEAMSITKRYFTSLLSIRS